MIKYINETVYETPVYSMEYNDKRLTMFKVDNSVKWLFKSKNGDDKFIVTMEDYEIYECFFRLFSDIENCRIFDDDEMKYICEETSLLNINDEIKNTYMYKGLYHDNIIEWVSNDATLFISKGNDYIQLHFIPNILHGSSNVSFDNDPVKYYNCTRPFFRHFDDMSKIDLEYHQMNFYDMEQIKK